MIELDPGKPDATIEARGLHRARADEVFAGETLTVEDHRQNHEALREWIRRRS